MKEKQNSDTSRNIAQGYLLIEQTHLGAIENGEFNSSAP